MSVNKTPLEALADIEKEYTEVKSLLVHADKILEMNPDATGIHIVRRKDGEPVMGLTYDDDPEDAPAPRKRN